MRPADLVAALCGPALAGGLLLAATPAAAQDASVRLKEIETRLEQSRDGQARLARESERLAGEVSQLRRELLVAARTAQEHEATLSETEAALERLEREAALKRDRLAGQRERLATLAGALQRLARRPVEALLAMPGPALDAVRTAKLLAATIPEIEGEAAALRSDLAALAATQADIARQRARLAATRSALEEERRRVERLLARKERARDDTEAARRKLTDRVLALTASAGDLKELIGRLEAERAERLAAERVEAERRPAALEAARPQERPALAPAAPAPSGQAVARLALPPAPPETRPAPPPSGPPSSRRLISAARGALTMPVAGRVAARYGERDEAGRSLRGMQIETRPLAQVVAPFDGQVVFAGPFRGYGLILIVDHGEGYHSLLAGLGRVDGTVGQWLLAGEPVGLMAAGPATEMPNPRLYMELRRDGEPINPLPWLAAGSSKVTG